MQRKHGHKQAARRKAATSVTFLLYGTAQRDPKEQVAMFFSNEADREEFAKHLPGRYRSATLTGVDCEAMNFAVDGWVW